MNKKIILTMLVFLLVGSLVFSADLLPSTNKDFNFNKTTSDNLKDVGITEPTITQLSTSENEPLKFKIYQSGGINKEIEVSRNYQHCLETETYVKVTSPIAMRGDIKKSRVQQARDNGANIIGEDFEKCIRSETRTRTNEQIIAERDRISQELLEEIADVRALREVKWAAEKETLEIGEGEISF